MLRSMTGFGKGTVSCPQGKITAEIKSLNHKSLSITCNPFNGLFFLDEKIKELFDRKIHRGKVFVRITREKARGKKGAGSVEINAAAARDYLRKVNDLKKKLRLKGELQLSEVISLPGVVETNNYQKEEEIWPHIKRALSKALDSLLVYRKKEGARLEKDLNARVKRIKEHLKGIKKNEKKSVSEYRKKLLESIQSLAGGAATDKNRLETEVALFARNCDISEETTRLDGHLVAYKDAISKVKTDTGKKLDFIAQEMQREANTIGAKSSDYRISRSVIEIKTEIEKMREQIKNIE